MRDDSGERKSADEGETGTGFERMAEESQPGFLREFWLFLRTNKKWWLSPILVILLLLLVLVLIGNSPLAPFFYPFL